MQAHRRMGQQQDNLCGAYWTALLLSTYTKVRISPEEVGLLAGSVLPIGDPIHWVPPGANPRQDYCLTLPETEQIEISGTSALGLIHAVAKVSNGEYCFVPLQANWTTDQVESLLTLCWQNPDWQAIPISNICTGYFWGASLSFVDALAYLHGNEITPPPADWSVGHFTVIAGRICAARSLILIQDTYFNLGWDGYHLQSGQAVADALNRQDQTSQGGVLLFIASKNRTAVEQAVVQIGLKTECWDNGTPWTAG